MHCWNFILPTMERKRLQQQRMKQQQQRVCISQQDLTQALARMRPTGRDERPTGPASMPISISSSVDALTIPSVSQLIKDFESRATSTPFESTEELVVLDKPTVPKRRGRAFSSQRRPLATMKNNADAHHSSSMSSLSISKTKENLRSPVSTRDEDQRALPRSSSSSSSYHSFESQNHITVVQQKKTAGELRRREKEFNTALAELISLSNDADISSSISSASSRSLIHRGSSSQDRSLSISMNIALLNDLLDVLALEQNSPSQKPTNHFW